MQELKLSDEQKQLLHDQVIDAERPGTVLRDFQFLLDFVGTEGLKAAGKYNLFPIEKIEEMDLRLTRPLQLKWQRPQLRSHPYLKGLHLLLRASGLSRVAGTGAKARLQLDAVALEGWHALNATEQYFTLLEAWLLDGRPEMVGDRRGMFLNFLGDCLQMWRFPRSEGHTF